VNIETAITNLAKLKEKLIRDDNWNRRKSLAIFHDSLKKYHLTKRDTQNNTQNNTAKRVLFNRRFMRNIASNMGGRNTRRKKRLCKSHKRIQKNRKL